MNPTENIKDIAQILINNFEPNYGICRNLFLVCAENKICFEEYQQFDYFLQENKPKDIDFFGYWWYQLNNAGTIKRIKFLQSIINSYNEK